MRNFLRIGGLVGILAISLGVQRLQASDIDLYANPASSSGAPRVLFVIDTGANFGASAATPCTAYSAAAGGGAPSLGNTGGGVEQCALVDSIAALPDSSVEIGLLVNNNNNFATDTRASTDPAYHEVCQGSAGGCVIRRFTLMTPTAKTELINFIKSWKLSGSNTATEFNVKSGGDATASMMQEAWAYFNGKIGMSGKNYGTSLLGASCQRGYVIFIGNSLNNSGGPADSATPTPDNTTTGLRSAQVGASTAQLQKITDTVRFPVTTCGVTSLAAGNAASDWSNNWADEWARLMYQQDGSSTLDSVQNITTYTIGVINNTGSNTCKPDYPALLTTMAKYGGGRYFQTNTPAEVRDAIQSALNEIQAVNSVFAAASLPVSTNAQGTFDNQVFIGMFRPDARATPRWLGNMKQYQFAFNSTGELQLSDATGTAALVTGTGFLSPNARSYWTDNTGGPTGGFFINDSKPVAGAFDSPDGEHVEKGGAAQVLRNTYLTENYTTPTVGGSRRLYTYCPSGTGCNANLTVSANRFASDNASITAAALDDTVVSTITSITRGSTSATEGTATATTSAPHGFSVGDTVTIAGATPAAYSGAKVVTAVTGTTFSYDVTMTTAASAAIGGSNTFSARNRLGACLTECTQNITAMSRSGTEVTATITATGGSAATRTANATLFATGLTSVQISYTGSGSVAASEADYVVTSASVVSGSVSQSGSSVTFKFNISTSPATPATLSSATAQRGAASFNRTTLINWVRGQDNKSGDELGPGGTVTIRPSVHGDVIHSQPAVINYGGGKVVVFYGANDGVFRAVNGAQTGSTTFGTTNVAAGGELWGLVLPDHFSKLNRLRENSPRISLGPTPVAGSRNKDFFVDGSPGVYQRLKADGTIDKAYLFLTMRRGGRFIYALDVTDPMTPTVKWVVKNTTTGYSELGQTWSRPRVIAVKGYSNPLIVFGAGYDADNQDLATPTIGGDTMGRGIFALDVEDGSIAWKATFGGVDACASAAPFGCTVTGMKWSIPADITPVDRDFDGYTDRLYTADTGGNVWRIDLQDGASVTRDKWRVTHFAALGCDAGACTSGVPRKFFYPPNVFLRASASDVYDLVGIGSGDREHPLISDTQAVAVQNRFFVLKDVNTSLAPPSGTTPIISNVVGSSGLRNVTGSSTGWDGTVQGFYLNLGTGEQVVNTSLTLAGTTFFGTNQPVGASSTTCTSGLGIARSYAIDVTTGLSGITGYTANGSAVRASSLSRTFDGGGMPPSPVAGVVNVRNPSSNQIEQAAFCIGCGLFAVAQDAASSLGAEGVGGSTRTQGMTGFQQIRRNYWYRR